MLIILNAKQFDWITFFWQRGQVEVLYIARHYFPSVAFIIKGLATHKTTWCSYHTRKNLFSLLYNFCGFQKASQLAHVNIKAA